MNSLLSGLGDVRCLGAGDSLGAAVLVVAVTTAVLLVAIPPFGAVEPIVPLAVRVCVPRAVLLGFSCENVKHNNVIRSLTYSNESSTDAVTLHHEVIF